MILILLEATKVHTLPLRELNQTSNTIKILRSGNRFRDSLGIMSTSTSAATTTTFALTPLKLNPDEVVDLSSKEGQSLYKRNITTLPILFDRSQGNILTFMTQVSERAHAAS